MASSLDALIGAHPDALEKMYRAGRAADPGELGAAPRTRLLAVAPAASIFLLTRPLLRAMGSERAPPIDKRFDPGGRSGRDVISGKTWYRFRVEPTASQLDGRPTLLLSYADPADGNLWPVPAMFDELRAAGGGLAIGVTLIRGRRAPLFWFGMEPGPLKASRSS